MHVGSTFQGKEMVGDYVTGPQSIPGHPYQIIEVRLPYEFLSWLGMTQELG